MRIGLAVGEIRGVTTVNAVVEQVRAAAEAGFPTAWSSQALGIDALTSVAVAGAAVPGIEMGTAVIPVPQRHPLVLASQALTVQSAVSGRLTLGIGAGIGAMITGMYGMAADRPAARMREYLGLLNPLLQGHPVNHRGFITAAGAVSVSGVKAPSVLLAALGPSMLQAAGELTDGTVTWMTGPRTLATHIVPTIAKAATDAGRTRPRIVAGLPVWATDDVDAARSIIGERFGVAAQVPEYRRTLAREGLTGPAGVAIVGDAAALERGIDQLRDAGVTDFMAVPCGNDDDQRRTIDALSELARAALDRTARTAVHTMRTAVADAGLTPGAG
ncbi:TIGR03564 family F420-dependent LLM class oxidoreductase [Mycobacterium sp. 852002-51057_SCH5723018]|uniref:TIGR03564 family F420-dependent LLM class oxidoreductase n=1 Tax=Mycobacterium sp. 852002-51057_SCH5723018 TaxID=1834094 RepID=UPI0007FF5A33|nr:TIGR03564 family F420-dependent LLM class oxidoreductase [Mycobacterium sp. 852002-51057_SCH5723018]OBG19742.1 LLM class F420-dependent oxidoreductase [Mycobacterium sp. 852002-51057_SCH5723018]